jgi:MFS family permease
MDRRFVSLILLTFINVLGFSVMLPVFPFIIDSFGGSALTYGVLLASYSVFQLLSTPILGSLGDKYGRKPIIRICQVAAFIGWIILALSYFIPVETEIYGISLALIVIIFSRMIDGIAGGSFSVTNAYVSDITKAHEKTKAFGILSGVFGIGYLIGPVIGAYTSSFAHGYFGTALFAIGLSILTMLFTWRYLPESLPENKRVRDLEIHVLKEINVFSKLMKFRPNSFVYKLFFVRMFHVFVFTAYIALIILYMKDVFHLDQYSLGTLYLILGFFVLINQMYLTKKCTEWFGELKTYYIGLLAMFVGLVTLGFIDTLWVFLLNSYILILGISMSMITFKSLITIHTEETRQGEVNGLDESIIAGAAAVAPLTFGYVYDQIYGLSFLFLAIILIFPHFVLRLRTKRFLIRHP